MPIMLNPASTWMTSPVIPAAMSEHRNAAVFSDVVDGDVAPQGGPGLDLLEYLAEVGDAGCGQGLDRPGRDGVRPDPRGAQRRRDVAHVRFQTRLCRAHHVVVRDHPGGAEVGQGQQSAVAPVHHGPCRLGESREAVCAHIVRDRVRVPGEGFEIVALQCLAGSECDRVHDDVESVPAFTQRFERAVDLGIACDVAFQDDVRARLGREPGHALAETFVLAGEREVGALPAHRARNSPGDRAIAGNPQDQGSLAFEKRHRRSGPAED